MKRAKTGICMTATECVNEMRAYGIPCNMKSLMDGIEKGFYPFGRILFPDSGSSRRNVQIFRVDFEAFIRSKMPKEQI